jgi:hypothetical protein
MPSVSRGIRLDLGRAPRGTVHRSTLVADDHEKDLSVEVQRISPRCTTYHSPRHEMSDVTGKLLLAPFTE